MKIKKIVSGIYSTIKRNSSKLTDSQLCGVPLQTYAGTIRKKEDQDDAWFFELAKNHNIIFDIGANIGYTALLAMIQNPNRKYLLVDPNPLALQKAQGNLLNNNLGFKAQYYSAFVSDTPNETIKFYTLGSGAAGSMHASHAESAAAVNYYQTVTTVTLDQLYTYYDLTPDLIIDWSRTNDYKVYYLKSGEELSTGEPVKSRGKCHLLLLPKEKPYFAYLKDIGQNAALP